MSGEVVCVVEHWTGGVGASPPHPRTKLRRRMTPKNRANGCMAISDMTATGTTEIRVKGPKYNLRVNTKDVWNLRQPGGGLRSSHPSKKA